MVIQVEALSAQSISAVAEFLLANIELRYDLGDLDTHLGARPILIEASQNLHITERTLWSTLVDSCSDAAQLISRYVDAQIARTHSDRELYFTSYFDSGRRRRSLWPMLYHADSLTLLRSLPDAYWI